MRLQLAGVPISIPFDHLLHAHSHTLYFGWAGLAILAGALGAMPKSASRWLRLVSVGLVASTPAILLGFLSFGYNPATIAISTVVMFLWYASIVGWWRGVRGVRSTAHKALRAAMAYLVVASGGVWVLAALQASGRGTVLSEALAVHAFVGGFGWFMVLGVVGLLLLHAGRLRLTFDPAMVRLAIRWWASLAWVTFPLAVVGGPETPILGPASRIAGLGLLVPAVLWVRALWSAAPTDRRLLWRSVAAWFALAAVTAAAAAVGGSDALALGGRQAVVIHLHALLVGFVTTSLAAVWTDRRGVAAIGLHILALGIMLAGLAVVALGAVGAGMWVAAAGSVVLWAAGVLWCVQILRFAADPAGEVAASAEPTLVEAIPPAATVIGSPRRHRR